MSLGRFGRRLVAGVIGGALLFGAIAAGASAHALLVRSSPQAGARLSRAPGTMILHFSEPIVAGSQRVQLRSGDGHAVALGRSHAAGTVVDQPLPARLHGVFLVYWRVVSADGHVTRGEFAFAAGATGAGGALPRISNGSPGTAWSGVAPSWLVFVGLSLALGGLLSEMVVWRSAPGSSRSIAAPVVPGVIVGVIGAAWQLVLLAGAERGGGVAAGLDTRALQDAIGTRPGALSLALLAALVLAGGLAGLRRLRPLAIVALLCAVGLSAVRGHSGTSGVGWAVVADAVHLATVAVWIGALAHLVLVAARLRSSASVTLAAGARRYSRFVLPTVLVALASGVLTAVPEFRSVGDVLSTGYGRTLLVKAGVISAALLLALVARQRALRVEGSPRLRLLSRLTAAEVAAAMGALVAAAVLVNGAPPRSVTAAEASAAVLEPPPVSGPTVQLADLAGQLVVAVTAGRQELQFKVFAPGYQASGRIGLTVDARPPDGKTVTLTATPCGTGCFSIRFPLRHGITEVRARAVSNRWQGGDVRFAIPWPLGPQRPRLPGRVIQALRPIRSLTFSEQLTIPFGRPQPPVTRTLSGARFLELGPLGSQSVDVRALGVRRGVTEYAFTSPSAATTIWYRIWVARDDRLRRALLVGEQGRVDLTVR